MPYADSSLDADYNAALSDLADMQGEKIVIQGVSYACTLGSQVVAQTFGDRGNAREVIRLTAMVRKNLFPVAPVLGNKAVSARGLAWRIFRIDPALSTYDFILETDKK